MREQFTDDIVFQSRVFDILGEILPRELEVGNSEAQFDEFTWEFRGYIGYLRKCRNTRDFNIYFDESLPIVYLRFKKKRLIPQANNSFYVVDLKLCDIVRDGSTGNEELQTARNICKFIKDNVPAIVQHYDNNDEILQALFP